MTPDQQKALEFDDIAENIFAPVYPLVASYALEETACHHGVCLDIGCGGGHLGLHIARQSTMHVILVDQNPAALTLARQRAADWQLLDRVTIVSGDVHHLPLAAMSVDLCVSRGSLWFWQDSPRAFAEVMRVMKPNTKALIGCGFGNATLHNQIKAQLAARNPGKSDSSPRQHAGADRDTAYYQKIIAGLTALGSGKITDNEQGFWLHLTRTAAAVEQTRPVQEPSYG